MEQRECIREEMPITKYRPVRSHLQITTTQAVKIFHSSTAEVFTELHLHDFTAKNCTGVVPVDSAGIEEGAAVLRLLPCPQGSLADVLYMQSAAYSEPEVFAWFFSMLETINTVHQLRVAMCNIDLSNWLLGAENKVYLTDFGSAVLIETGRSIAVSSQLHFPSSCFELDLKALGKLFVEIVARKRIPYIFSLSKEESSALVQRKCQETGYSSHLSNLITYLLHDCLNASGALDLFGLEKTLPNPLPQHHSVLEASEVTELAPVSQPCVVCRSRVEADLALLVCPHRLCSICLHGAVTQQGLLCPKCKQVTVLRDIEGRTDLSVKIQKYVVGLLRRL